MLNPIIPILTSIVGFAAGAAVSHILTKHRCDQENAVRIEALRQKYKQRNQDTGGFLPDENREEKLETPPENTPESVGVPRENEGIFMKHDPNAVQYAKSVSENAGYFGSDDSEAKADPMLPRIIDEEEFAAHSCPSQRLRWYPEVGALILGEGEDIGAPVMYTNFTVGDNNLAKLIPGENDFIIVHNPTQNYDYEIFAYSGKPNYNELTNSSPFGGTPEDGE